MSTGIYKHKSGEEASNYIDGRCSKIYYCIESNCTNKITYHCWRYGNRRCHSCENRRRFVAGIMNINGENNPGKHPSKATRTKMSIAKQGVYDGKKNPMFGKRTTGKFGKYKGTNMRSSYETKFAYFLDLSGYKWEYESKTFNLGKTTYTPDFYIPEWDCYIEIKGYWHKDRITKFKKFQGQYPNIRIKVLMQPDLIKLGIL